MLHALHNRFSKAPKDITTKKASRAHRRKGRQNVAPDIEAPPARRRHLSNDPSHKMMAPGYSLMKATERNGEDGDPHVASLRAKSLKDTMRTAIDKANKDDLEKDKSDPIQGNCYRYFAFSKFIYIVKTSKIPEESDDEEEGDALTTRATMMSIKETKYRRLGMLRTFMAILVILVQFLGPIALSFWAYSGIRWRNVSNDVSSFDLVQLWNSTDPGSAIGEIASHRVGAFAEMGKKLLGFLFLVLFLMNAILVLQNEKKQLQKMLDLAKVLQHVGWNKNIRSGFLLLGAFLNCWTILGCGLAILPCLIDADNVKDVIFDALALLFLVRLDDVSGDLGYLNTIWDGELLGRIYGGVHDHMHGVLQFDEDEDDVVHTGLCSFDTSKRFVNVCIRFTQIILFLMTIIMPPMYLLLGGVETVTDIRREEHYGMILNNTASIAEMRAEFSMLSAEMALLRQR